MSSEDQFHVGSVSGGANSFGGHGNTINIGAPATQSHQPVPRDTGNADSPRQALYAFADIVGYSQLNARLQKISQNDLLELLNAGLTHAGVRPDQVVPQDQGDARLLWFPGGTDAGRVLAMMPRYVDDVLIGRNQDMAPHARMRVRLSFTMGVAGPGATGLTGNAPVSVVRLGNSVAFRRLMNAAPDAHCGVIMDSYLHGEYVRQAFRPDINPDDYTQVRIFDRDKGFEASAWIMLFGYSGPQVAAMLR
jgi:hypothetical protein